MTIHYVVLNLNQETTWTIILNHSQGHNHILMRMSLSSQTTSSIAWANFPLSKIRKGRWSCRKCMVAPKRVASKHCERRILMFLVTQDCSLTDLAWQYNDIRAKKSIFHVNQISEIPHADEQWPFCWYVAYPSHIYLICHIVDLCIFGSIVQ